MYNVLWTNSFSCYNRHIQFTNSGNFQQLKISANTSPKKDHFNFVRKNIFALSLPKPVYMGKEYS